MNHHLDPRSRAVRAGMMLLALVVAVPARAADATRTDPLAADEQRLQEARVGTDGPALLEFFRKRTATDARLFDIDGLIRRLGDDSYEVRQKASADLAAL